MQCHVTRCVICISNNVEYLDQEQSYRNSTKEVGCELKCFSQCNEEKNWTKCRVIASLEILINIGEFHDGYIATANVPVVNGNEYSCINMRHFSLQFSIVIGLVHGTDIQLPAQIRHRVYTLCMLRIIMASRKLKI